MPKMFPKTKSADDILANDQVIPNFLPWIKELFCGNIISLQQKAYLFGKVTVAIKVDEGLEEYVWRKRYKMNDKVREN